MYFSKNGEASQPESKPNGFDPLNLIQIMLAQENRTMVVRIEVRASAWTFFDWIRGVLLSVWE